MIVEKHKWNVDGLHEAVLLGSNQMNEPSEVKELWIWSTTDFMEDREEI
jgi:hypothetical protein